MNDNLLILGAGGHGQSVMDIARAQGSWRRIAFLDDNSALKEIYGCPVLGGLEEYTAMKADYRAAFVALGDNHLRINWINKLQSVGFTVPVLVHPHSWIGGHVSLGDGCVVMAGTCVNIGTEIERGCILNTGCALDHHNRLGEGVHISPGVHTGGTITVGAYTWICTGAAVGNNVSIAANVVIAAGAAVVEDIIEPGLYAGVPAKRKRKTV